MPEAIRGRDPGPGPLRRLAGRGAGRSDRRLSARARAREAGPARNRETCIEGRFQMALRTTEAIQCEPCLLPGFDIHKHVVVLLPWRLPLPIEIRRIVRRHFDVRPAWENRVLFRAAAAQQQVFHPFYLASLGRVHVPIEDDNVQILCVRRKNLVGILSFRDGTHTGAGKGRIVETDEDLAGARSGIQPRQGWASEDARRTITALRTHGLVPGRYRVIQRS